MCNQAGLSTSLSPSLVSAFSVCVVIYLAVALEVMIVYIQGGTILNTQDSDCLPILRVTSRLLSSPQCTSVSSLSLSSQIGCGVSPPGPLVVTNQFHQRGSKTN